VAALAWSATDLEGGEKPEKPAARRQNFFSPEYLNLTLPRILFPLPFFHFLALAARRQRPASAGTDIFTPIGANYAKTERTQVDKMAPKKARKKKTSTETPSEAPVTPVRKSSRKVSGQSSNDVSPPDPPSGAKPRKKATAKAAPAFQDSPENSQPGSADVAIFSKPADESYAPVPDSKCPLTFGPYFAPGKDPMIIAICPSLKKFPEVLTMAAKTELAKQNVKSVNLDLPLNYGFFPLHEIQDAGKPIRLKWWNCEPGALGFKDLEPREPTSKEVAKLQATWLGKEFPSLTLYYPLSATAPRLDDLAQILGFGHVKDVLQHQTTLGKLFGRFQGVGTNGCQRCISHPYSH
jgi:hypothetical protein